jgi:hypothetical protein
MVMSKLSKSSPALPPSLCESSSRLLFISKVKNIDKGNGPDKDKTELIKMEFFMDPDNPGSKNS